MKAKIYRHSFKKDDKIFYGDWHLSLTIPKKEEERYIELSKTYNYIKSLGIEESELEANCYEILNLNGQILSMGMMSISDSFPEVKEGVDINEAINDIIGE